MTQNMLGGKKKQILFLQTQGIFFFFLSTVKNRVIRHVREKFSIDDHIIDVSVIV